MKLYSVLPTGHAEVAVFAHSYDQAAELFLSWHVIRNPDTAPSFEIRERNAAWPGLDTSALHEALRRGVIGVGRYDPAEGWQIIPPADFWEEAR